MLSTRPFCILHFWIPVTDIDERGHEPFIGVALQETSSKQSTKIDDSDRRNVPFSVPVVHPSIRVGLRDRFRDLQTHLIPKRDKWIRDGRVGKAESSSCSPPPKRMKCLQMMFQLAVTTITLCDVPRVRVIWRLILR